MLVVGFALLGTAAFIILCIGIAEAIEWIWLNLVENIAARYWPRLHSAAQERCSSQ